MSFFQKDQTDKNLQYDDIAFLHFLLTVALVAVVFFGYMVYKKLRAASVKNIKNYDRLKKCGLYTKQISNEAVLLRNQHITASFWTMLAFFVGFIIISGGLMFFIGTHTTQMIGFDPYEILGISQDATVTQTKKAYRKLALEYHPDRNPHNPEAQAKFIMISKSYQCLTDEEKKQNCQKFGNPDGKTSFEVGIGLPKFLITKENQFLILPIVFALLLVVVPMIFINWTNKLKTQHQMGLQMVNYPVLHQFFQPNFTPSYGFYLLTMLKELQTDKKLQKAQKQALLQELRQKTTLNVQFIEKNYSQGQMFMLYKIYRQLAYKEVDPQLSKKLPELINALVHFGCYYARKMFHEKFLLPNALPITWMGTKHLHNLISFSRYFYNGSFLWTGATSFDYIDMPKQDRQIANRYPVANIYQLINDQQKLKQHVALFPQHHREHIKKQLDEIPQLTLELKIKLGDKETHQFNTSDFPDVYYKVERKNSSSGYCYLPHLYYLKEEKFYFMVVYKTNLIFFNEIIFEAGQDKFIGKFPYKQSVARDMQIFAFLLSDCREGIDTQVEFRFNVKQETDEEKSAQVEFNEQDLYIQKLPKSGIEKALSLDLQDNSDNELSSDQQQDSHNHNPNVKKVNGKKYMKMERQTGGCQDCDHEH